MTPAPELSIILVSWNTAGLLADCLRSLQASPLAARLEVIVVDNASTDGSAARAQQEFPAVRVVANRENVGYARANNQGLAVAQGRYVLLLNSDTVVPPEALPALVAFMDGQPKAGVCGPALVRPDGSPQPFAWGSDPTLPYLVARAARRLLQGRALHRWQLAEPRPVDWVSGACLLARREAVAQVGGLDEAMFMYFEDNDWCLRFRRAGWQVWVAPQARVVHLGGQSAAQNPAAPPAYGASLRYFYRKHYSRAAQWALAWLLPIYGQMRHPPR